MFGLKNNKNFKYLEMKRIGFRYSPCIIGAKDLVNFKNMNLEIIEASDNEILDIKIDALQNLPQTLKTLKLQNNNIIFGAYWKNLGSLTQLKELNLDNEKELTYKFPSKYPSSHIGCKATGYINMNDGMEKFSGHEKIPVHSGRHNMILSIPPNMEVVSMKYGAIAYDIDLLHFRPNNSLRKAFFQGNVFRYLNGPVKGLKRLETLDLSECSIQHINNSFLTGFKVLDHLNLHGNKLGESFNTKESDTTFSSMKNLTYLNISANDIFHISPDFFKDCQKLQTLDLSQNRLSSANFKISHMKNLSSLFLSKNDICHLEKSFRKHIDSIWDEKKKFQLDLRFNPITCGCVNIDFLKWITSKKQILYGNKSDYQCRFLDGSSKSMDDDGYDQVTLLLERQCKDHHNLFMYVAVVTALLLITILVLIAFRFQFKIKYAYYTTKLLMSSKQELRNNDFDYDVFICYAHQDENFVVEVMSSELGDQRGLRLLIHGKDFHAGGYIMDNIVGAVHRSRKTLIVVTKSMLASKWCLFEFKMAQQESINTNRNVLVFLFLEDIAYKDLTLEMLSYIKTNVAIAYPNKPQNRQAFWAKLVHDLKMA